jgi:hypothetical protein
VVITEDEHIPHRTILVFSSSAIYPGDCVWNPTTTLHSRCDLSAFDRLCQHNTTANQHALTTAHINADPLAYCFTHPNPTPTHH